MCSLTADSLCRAGNREGDITATLAVQHRGAGSGLLFIINQLTKPHHRITAAGQTGLQQAGRQTAQSLVAARNQIVFQTQPKLDLTRIALATTAASRTFGWRYSTVSTSMVEIFSPPEMITSLDRSFSSI